MNVSRLTASLDPASGELVLELVEGAGSVEIEVERLEDRVRVRVRGLGGRCDTNVSVSPMVACEDNKPIEGRDGSRLFALGLGARARVQTCVHAEGG